MNGLSAFGGQLSLASYSWHNAPPGGIIKTRQAFRSLNKLLEQDRKQKMPEIGYALVDNKRTILKKKAMTSHEAGIKNKTTKQFGLEWVRCGL